MANNSNEEEDQRLESRDGGDTLFFKVRLTDKAHPAELRQRREQRELRAAQRQKSLQLFRPVVKRLRRLSRSALFRETLGEALLELPQHARARIVGGLCWDRDLLGTDEGSSHGPSTEDSSDADYTTAQEEETEQQQQQLPQQQQGQQQRLPTPRQQELEAVRRLPAAAADQEDSDEDAGRPRLVVSRPPKGRRRALVDERSLSQ